KKQCEDRTDAAADEQVSQFVRNTFVSHFLGSFLTTKLRGLRFWTIASRSRFCQESDRLTQRRKDRKDAKAGQMLRARLCAFAIFASLREKSLRVAVAVLLELAVERLAADAEGAGGVGFVAFGVVERGLDRLALNLFHRGRNRDLESRRASLARGFRALDFDPVAILQCDLADRFGQVFEFNRASGSNDHRSLDRVFKLANVAGPVVSDQRLERV